jgi:tRNA-2-methylthio-N6-dimethylallyladenosine synthase
MKVHIKTYGCQMNVYDSGTMYDILYERGMIPTDDATEADLILVNTCAVRESAQNRVWGNLGHLADWKRRRPGRMLGVTGCMAQNEGQRIIDRCKYVDLVLGPDNIARLPGLLDQLASGKRRLVCIDTDSSEPEEAHWHTPAREERPPAYPRFISVQRGCDEKCTYCIVPIVRGHERFRPIESILDEARMLIDSGYREVTLIGQTVNGYRFENNDFADLLYKVAELPGLDRLRFTTSHPKWVTPRLIEAYSAIPNLCEQLHLPLQSGSDRMLKRMLRRYTAGEYYELLDQLREASANKPEPLAVSTDLIVGFPGESDEDFQMTLDAIGKARWDSAFTFIYSPRRGTSATRLKESVDPGVARERINALIVAQKAMAHSLNQELLSKTLGVLIQEITADGQIKGRSRSMKTVIIEGCSPDNTPCIGDIVDVRIERAETYHLRGSLAPAKSTEVDTK